MIKKFVLSSFIFFGLMLGLAASGAMTAQNPTTVYFFYGEGCPHCTAEKPFLNKMQEKYPSLKIEMLEVWKDAENKKLFQEFIEAYNVGRSGVPQTYIGTDAPTIGYGSEETTGVRLEQKISFCVEQGCLNPLSKVHPDQVKDKLPQVLAVEVPEIDSMDNEGANNNQIDSADSQEEEVTADNESANKNLVDIFLFTSTGCPHCANLENYLNSLKSEIPELRINHFDLRKNPESISLCRELANNCDGDINSVPMTFIGTEMFVGDQRDEIKQKIDLCLAAGCPSPIDRITEKIETPNNEAGASNNLMPILAIAVFIIIGAGLAIFFIIKPKKT